MPIKLNGATNGSIELNVPDAIGSDLQMTLPATAGEVIVKEADGSVDLGDVDIDSSGNVDVTGGGNLIINEDSKLYFEGDADDDYNAIWKADTENTVFTTSRSHIANIIDSNNDDTTAFWSVRHNGTTLAGSTELMRIDSSGNVGIGINNPSAGASTSSGVSFRPGNGDVWFNHSTGAGGTYTFFAYNGTNIGSISRSGTTAVSYNTSSDYRLKENIVDLSEAITRVKQLQPKRFNFIADSDTNVDGFIAHEAQTVVPEAITGTKDEVDDDGNAVMQGIDQSKLVPLLTAALQETIAKLETLETKVASLEATS